MAYVEIKSLGCGETVCMLDRGNLRNKREGDAVGRGEISFGCDKEDMHVTRRNSIQ